MAMWFSSRSVVQQHLVSVTTRAFPATWQLLPQTAKPTALQKLKSSTSGSGTDFGFEFVHVLGFALNSCVLMLNYLLYTFIYCIARNIGGHLIWRFGSKPGIQE